MEPQPTPDVVLVPGPLESAWEWLAHVIEAGDLAAAWPSTDANLRLALVQSWIHNRRTKPPVSGWNREELARGLVPPGSRHPLWQAFAARQVEKLRAWWGNTDLEAWGATVKGGVVDKEYELIRFSPIPAGKPLERRAVVPVPQAPGRGQGRLLLMHATDGAWVVAGFGPTPPTPGWPPKG